MNIFLSGLITNSGSGIITYHSLSHLTHPCSPSAGHICGPGEHTPHSHRGIAWENMDWAPGVALKSPLVWLWCLMRHGNTVTKLYSTYKCYLHKCTEEFYRQSINEKCS